MKNSTILLAVMLLSSVILADAQLFPGGGGFGRPGGGRICGRQICRFGQRCVYEQLVCIRPPCGRIAVCV
ncbi:hypothetical protein MTO96_001808 [Rhipicephalus appendiculatus]